jgi:hypothetical protein
MPTNLTGSAINATYDQLLHVDDGPTATEKTVYSGTGVATSLKVGTTSSSVGNIQLDTNTVRTLDTNGNLNLTPNGTGSVVVGKLSCTGGTISGITDLAIADGGTGASTASDARTNLGLGTMATQNSNNVAITGGAISGVTFTGSFTGLTLIESATFTTSNATTGVTLTNNALSADGTNTNIDIDITPKGTGEVNLPKVDIDGGAIDGTAIGANAVSTVKGSTVLATQQLGYTTGAGGTVAQLTSRTTGVTLNQITGQITLVAGTISGHEADEFTLTNSEIGANDVVVACIKSGCAAATRKYYQIHVVEVAAGSCVVSVGNIDNASIPSSGTDSPVIQFAVIKSVVA